MPAVREQVTKVQRLLARLGLRVLLNFTGVAVGPGYSRSAV